MGIYLVVSFLKALRGVYPFSSVLPFLQFSTDFYDSFILLFIIWNDINEEMTEIMKNHDLGVPDSVLQCETVFQVNELGGGGGWTGPWYL